MTDTNPYLPSTTTDETNHAQKRFGIGFKTTIAVVSCGTLALCLKSLMFAGGLFFVPFSFGPLLVTGFLSVILRGTAAQVVLAFSSIFYAVWFGYIYASVFYLHPDPQAPIAFIFVGIYALPVLLIFWLVAVFLRSRA